MERAMSAFLKIAALGIAIVLTACDAKPTAPSSHAAATSQIAATSQPAAPSQKAATNPSAVPAAVAPPSNCPPAIPGKDSVARTIKVAMLQVYGPDEAAAQFTVTAITPGADCRHLNLTYGAGGARSPLATGTLEYAGNSNWNLAFYGKRYPVR
jgi:hypothetical protein